jgi:hypothetical protein
MALMNNPIHERKFTIKLSELDANILLEALGKKQIVTGETRATRILVERLYRAMGVRLDK